MDAFSQTNTDNSVIAHGVLTTCYRCPPEPNGDGNYGIIIFCVFEVKKPTRFVLATRIVSIIYQYQR